MKPPRLFALLGLLLGVAARGLAPAPAGARADETPRVREDIDTVAKDAAKLANLNLAFATLAGLPASDPNNLINWANVHGRPGGPIYCEHGNELIWPWHRAYLYRFETALRASKPPATSGVTLAYWNWTAPPSGRRYPAAFEVAGSGLFPATVARRMTANAAPPLRLATELNLLKVPAWEVFGGSSAGPGQLEAQLHNWVHTSYVAGTMADTQTSARDPIFWAHHANLDRLWLEWQGKHPGQRVACQRCPLDGIPGNPVAADFQDVAALYQYGPKANPAGEPPAARFALASPLPAAFGRPARYRLAAPGLEFTEARFHAYGVTPPARTSYLARVFVSAAGRPPAPARDQDLLTYFVHWETPHKAAPATGKMAHPGAGAGGGGTDFTLDVTDRIRQALNASGNAPLELALDFAATGPDGDRPLDTGPGGVTVGRVTIEFRNAKEVELTPVQAPAN